MPINCSLVNKISTFQFIVYSSTFHILAITETWLSDCIFDNKLLPSGYTILRKDRNQCGGGVILAIDLQSPTQHM